MIRVGRRITYYLLRGQLEFLEIAAEQVSINLEHKADGRKNWTISNQETGETTDEAAEVKRKKVVGDRFTVEQFKLSDITINYLDEETGRRFSNHTEQLLVNTHDRARLTATLSGTVEDIPYSFSASSDLLRNLVNSKPWKIEAQGQIGEHPVSLTTEISMSNDAVDGMLEFQVKEAKVGNILNLLEITEGLEIFTRELQIEAKLKGSSLNEIISQSTFKVSLDDGSWTLHSHVDDRFQNISFSNATIESIESQELKIDFNGMIGKEPIEFAFRTNPLGDYVRGIDEARLGFEAKLAHADIKLSGNMMLPVSSKTLLVDMTVAGERLDQWNSIMINDLPPFGPYRLTGKLDMSPSGFHVTNFKSVIGSSDLGGSIDIDMTKKRPVWKMKLVSEQFQINDFDVEGYTLIPGKEKKPGEKDQAENQSKSNKDKQREMATKINQRLGETREIDRWDIDATVESRNIRSGKDRLGDGKISLSARKNSYDQEIQLDTLGGQISNTMGLQLVDDGISGYLKLDMDKFDYGILMRRIDPEADFAGLLSSRIDLRLSGNNYLRRFDRTNGIIDFAVWPQNTSAGDIDIWAVNIFQAVSSSVTTTESKINCAVGILDIEDGQLNEEFLAVDTTKVWLHGNIDINFPNETLELAMVPRPKKPKIGGIETPVYLKGSLNDKFDMSDLSIKKKDIVKTFVSIVFSPLHVPMRRIYGNKVPADGSEMCGKLLDRDYLHLIKAEIKEKEITIDDAYTGD